MKKSTFFIAILPLMGLLTTFQGSQEEERKEDFAGFLFSFQAYKNTISSSSSSNKMVSDPKNGTFSETHQIGNLVKIPVDKNEDGNVTARTLISTFVDTITQGEEGVIGGLSYWVEEPGEPEETEETENKSKQYTKITPSVKFSKGKKIHVLVPADKEGQLSKYISRLQSAEEESEDILVNEKKGWTKGEVGSAIAATVVVVFTIAGVIYYFVLPSKEASASPSREEEEEEEEEEEQQQEENEG